jgi:hypothetical protein
MYYLYFTIFVGKFSKLVSTFIASQGLKNQEKSPLRNDDGF